MNLLAKSHFMLRRCLPQNCAAIIQLSNTTTSSIKKFPDHYFKVECLTPGEVCLKIELIT